nr:signal peptidase I [Terriglobus saanensis]
MVLEKQERKETLLESISGMALMLVVGLFVLTFVAQNFEIPSPSMVPTLLIGDHVLVDHATFAPPTKWMPLVPYQTIRHGDVVVFLKPTLEGMILVKRAIGLPGDRIHLRHGILYRNGVAQKEPQISVPDESDPIHTYEPFRDDFPNGPADPRMTATWANEWQSHVVNGDLVVPDDMILGLGDNRVGSLDSRFWGFIPREAVLGRPLFVYWSFMTPEDQEQKTSASERVAFFTQVVVHFFDQTRWKRTFHRIV